MVGILIDAVEKHKGNFFTVGSATEEDGREKISAYRFLAGKMGLEMGPYKNHPQVRNVSSKIKVKDRDTYERVKKKHRNKQNGKKTMS
jgi:hypothetical protein